MGPLPPLQWNGSDRAWLCRWLEMTTASLRDLQLMRQEAEDRVKAVLKVEGDYEEELDRLRVRRSFLVESEEKMGWARPARSKSGQNPAEVDEVIPTRTDQGKANEHVNISKRKSRMSQEAMSHGKPERTESGYIHELNQIMLGKSKSGLADIEQFSSTKTGQDQEHTQLKSWGTDPGKTQGDIKLIKSLRVTDSRQTQGAKWERTGATEELGQNPDHMEQIREMGTEPRGQNQEWNRGRENTLSVLLSDPTSLHRIGSGSWVPRLRLGSSGVTSDIMFTRRMSGKCLSTPSSGFYEASDTESISSSRSSLCSEAPSSSPLSVISPRRSSALRPRSIDCTAERRKELQSRIGGTRRPMSAGALDTSLFLPSFYHSQFDITEGDDMNPPDSFSVSPSLCVIQQRCRAERYICKLALKYRCQPSSSSLPPDLGPPVHRSFASLSLNPKGPTSCSPSPHCNSLSCSVGDVRRTPRSHGGSWGRFLSRIMLRRDPRAATSEMNLDQCGRGPHNPLHIPQSAEGELLRTKSVRDLLSVNQFKRSQRGLYKAY
ncbi:uncharacterized protein WCC33_009291 [Rhinophrynus dorsalis]